jgi:hypothetical protein
MAGSIQPRMTAAVTNRPTTHLDWVAKDAKGGHSPACQADV